MVYVRGHARDFDHWAEAGATGWGYADVLPYFKRMEHGAEPRPGSIRPGGVVMDLCMSQGARGKTPLYQAFVDAGRQAAFEVTDDYNGEKQEGFGPMEQTVWQGRRWSAANAYLKPALQTVEPRPGSRLRQACAVRRKGAPTGVEIERGGKVETVRANREVILAASAINSPKLLMLSGIGPDADASGRARHRRHRRPPRCGRKICRIIWSSTSSRPACSRSPSIQEAGLVSSKALIGAEWLLLQIR